MAKSAVIRPETPAVPLQVPLREIAPWAVFGGVVLMALLFLVGIDQGATAVLPGSALHELVHDSRHLLGFPCH